MGLEVSVRPSPVVQGRGSNVRNRLLPVKQPSQELTYIASLQSFDCLRSSRSLTPQMGVVFHIDPIQQVSSCTMNVMKMHRMRHANVPNKQAADEQLLAGHHAPRPDTKLV